MPVSGLPVAAEIALVALLQKDVVSSWKITGDRNNNTVFILRLTVQSSDTNQSAIRPMYRPLQKEAPESSVARQEECRAKVSSNEAPTTPNE